MIPINQHLKQYTFQHAALGVSILIGIMIFFTFFYSLQTWLQDWKISHKPLASVTFNTAKNEATHLVEALPEMHLFGKTFSESGYMPISNLQLHVTGIVKTNTEENGSISKAYISMEGQPSKIYQIGDSLPYGVKIYNITQDTVILENSGHLEKVSLARARLQFKPRSTEESE